MNRNKYKYKQHTPFHGASTAMTESSSNGLLSCRSWLIIILLCLITVLLIVVMIYDSRDTVKYNLYVKRTESINMRRSSSSGSKYYDNENAYVDNNKNNNNNNVEQQQQQQQVNQDQQYSTTTTSTTTTITPSSHPLSAKEKVHLPPLVFVTSHGSTGTRTIASVLRKLGLSVAHWHKYKSTSSVVVSDTEKLQAGMDAHWKLTKLMVWYHYNYH